MRDCFFCKITKKEVNAEVVYEDDATVAILDIHPIAPGHTMVVPKVHAQTILELPDEIIGGVFIAVKKTTAKLKKVLKPDGFTIGINHGSVSGQTIDHLHIHILPRWNGDGGGSVHSVVKNPPKASIAEMAKKIRNVE